MDTTKHEQGPVKVDLAGWYVRRGSYSGTTDDRLDRWYIGRDGEFFRPWGAGYRTRREAWAAVTEMVLDAGV